MCWCLSDITPLPSATNCTATLNYYNSIPYKLHKPHVTGRNGPHPKTCTAQIKLRKYIRSRAPPAAPPAPAASTHAYPAPACARTHKSPAARNSPATLSYIPRRQSPLPRRLSPRPRAASPPAPTHQPAGYGTHITHGHVTCHTRPAPPRPAAPRTHAVFHGRIRPLEAPATAAALTHSRTRRRWRVTPPPPPAWPPPRPAAAAAAGRSTCAQTAAAGRAAGSEQQRRRRRRPPRRR